MMFRLFVADPARTDGVRLYLSRPFTRAQVEALRQTYAYILAIPILHEDAAPGDFEPTSLVRRRVDHATGL